MAQEKKKWVPGNTKPDANKQLHSAIMKRSRLENKTNKNKCRDVIINYKKQKSIVIKFIKKLKFEYFSKYYPYKQAKPFWVKCKQYFANKHSKSDTKIMLSENSELIMKIQDIANTFNYTLDAENLNFFREMNIMVRYTQKMLKISLKTSRTIPVVKLSKNI